VPRRAACFARERGIGGAGIIYFYLEQFCSEDEGCGSPSWSRDMGRLQSPCPSAVLLGSPAPPRGVSLWGTAEIEQIVFNSNGNAKTMDLAKA
jgi:hypothetical protein